MLFFAFPGANKTSSASDCKIKSQYLCENQRCIPFNAVCNKKDDCGDGSDEGAKCEYATLYFYMFYYISTIIASSSSTTHFNYYYLLF